MHLSQGTFSFLPPLTDDAIRRQVTYCLDQGWAVNLEYTDDPHPRNTYWEMWGQPMFDLQDPAALMYELQACRKAFGNAYIRLSAFDATAGWESVRLSFIVNRPTEEPGFGLERHETGRRSIQYTLRSYAAERPSGDRY
jgi:ribulose-bisphosphate carboxylase small chain